MQSVVVLTAHGIPYMYAIAVIAAVLAFPVGSKADCADQDFTTDATNTNSNNTVCYEFVDQYLSYDQAARRCLNYGGYLPDLQSPEEIELMRVHHADDFFPTAWSANGHCVFLVPETVNIRFLGIESLADMVRSCFDHMRSTFFCAYAHSKKCDEGWVNYQDACFKLVKKEENFSYVGAKEVCQQEGAQPATILSLFENIVGQHLLEQAEDTEEKPSPAKVWIGLELEWEPCSNSLGEEADPSEEFACKHARVANEMWADGEAHYSELLPHPIGQLTQGWGEYPWLKTPEEQQPMGMKELASGTNRTRTCVHYFTQADYNIGGWGDADCDLLLPAVLCKKVASQ